MDEGGYFFVSKGEDLTVLNATGEIVCKEQQKEIWKISAVALQTKLC